jgi:iron complex outermembrane receptor protein
LGAGALINCQSALLTEPQPLLGGAPFVQLNGPCTAASALNSPAGGGGLAGGTINFFGTQGAQTALVNGGSLKTSGIDVSATWTFEEVFGGRLTLTGDWTWVLEYDASDYIVAGIKVADGYDGIGQQNALTGRNNQRISEHVGSLGVNYRRGRHNFNWSTRFRSSLINDDLTDFVAQNDRNPNIGNASGVSPTGAACAPLPPSPPVPAGAGTGQFGTFCAAQNLRILSGQKIEEVILADFSYQADLGQQTTLTVTVQNVFDTDPKFSREALGYDASTGSALGRTVRFGVRRKW